ncbi:uncharacterized protein LOC116196734 [Punica granatum]|uniref:Uncharacterized protein LOC116196734 n=2 Tax=Punica granatum TaxID=22663 RepID=A0A6P8CMA2_PUNGR|nr:uncharacterized protein LOC116196734 [Punica granatum]PKI35129.1 hypothetical protein CRG98_044480 [Punica granatum]
MSRGLIAVLLIVALAWAYQSVLRPPPPKVCRSTGGPPVTAPRIRLRDGRHLAYSEFGVPKDMATRKIIFGHAFDSCRHATIAKNLSPEVIEELGLYIVSFDRPGYGESDPDPRRTPKSLALDVEELADSLGLGLKFYVIGHSMGGQAVWGCLKYIPHRLAGAALLAPVVNYWWAGFPDDSAMEYHRQPKQDQWAVRVAHYFPWLTYWWNTQRWFPSSSVTARNNPAIFSHQDIELIRKVAGRETYRPQVRQQGEFESIHRDMMVGFGHWEFSPMDLENPFPDNAGSVHLWQGDDDKVMPVSLQRLIAQKLPWIHYHEIPSAGHLFPIAEGKSEAVVRSLVEGQK